LAEPLTRAVPLAGGLLEPKGPGTVARAALAPGIAEIGRDEPSMRSGTRPEPPGLTGRADPLARPDEPAGGTETDAEPLAEPVDRTRADPLAEPLLWAGESVDEAPPGTVARPLAPLVGALLGLGAASASLSSEGESLVAHRAPGAGGGGGA
jgi:hypothetical protein